MIGARQRDRDRTRAGLRGPNAAAGLRGPNAAASNILLIVGYATAAAAAAKLGPAWRERRLAPFLAFEAGTACVTAGLALRRKWLPAMFNGVTFLAAAAAWTARGRRR
jgi:hypothetical protein